MASFFKHDSVVIDAGARVGRGTKIWHFSHVSGGAEIGEDCTLGQNVYVGNGARVGRGVKIQNNVSVYAGVTLEDDVFCGPSVVFSNVKAPRAFLPKDPAEYAPTRVGRGASIGANATIICGVTVGCFALVGAGAVVTRDVPDYGLALGVPARRVGWVCRCGTRLALERSAARCAECGRGYAQRGPRTLVCEE